MINIIREEQRKYSKKVNVLIELDDACSIPDYYNKFGYYSIEDEDVKTIFVNLYTLKIAFDNVKNNKRLEPYIADKLQDLYDDCYNKLQYVILRDVKGHLLIILKRIQRINNLVNSVSTKWLERARYIKQLQRVKPYAMHWLALTQRSNKSIKKSIKKQMPSYYKGGSKKSRRKNKTR